MARVSRILRCAAVLLIACLACTESCRSVVHNKVFTEAPMDVAKSFAYHKVVPDVVSTAPGLIVHVTHPSGAKVNLGNELTPTSVKDQPTLAWDAEVGALYTVIMTDPDAPSRSAPTYREWHHWLVGNVPGNDIASGDLMSAYVGAGPGLGSGLHRYVFLVYKQPARIEFDEPILTNTSGAKRHLFSSTSFAKKYNLGDPVAGNFYQAKYDDYVPELYKQLGL